MATLFFATQPSIANEFWENRCKKDLSKFLELHTGVYAEFKGPYSIQRAAISRSIGVVHAFCIDRLISVATGHVNWRPKDSANKQNFISELEWVRDLLKGDMKQVFLQSKVYRSLGGEGRFRVLAVYLRQWAIYKQLPEAKFDLIQEGFLEAHYN